LGGGKQGAEEEDGAPAEQSDGDGDTVSGPFGLMFEATSLKCPGDTSCEQWKADTLAQEVEVDEEWSVASVLAEVKMMRRPNGRPEQLRFYCVKWTGYETDPFHCGCWLSQEDVKNLEPLDTWEKLVAKGAVPPPPRVYRADLSDIECICGDRDCASFLTQLPPYSRVCPYVVEHGPLIAAAALQDVPCGDEECQAAEEKEEAVVVVEEEDGGDAVEEEEEDDLADDDEDYVAEVCGRNAKRKRSDGEDIGIVVGCPSELPVESMDDNYCEYRGLPLSVFEQVPCREVRRQYARFLRLPAVALKSTDVDARARRDRLYFTDIRGYSPISEVKPRPTRTLREILGWTEAEWPVWFRHDLLKVDSRGNEYLNTVLSKNGTCDAITACQRFIKENPNKPLPRARHGYWVSATKRKEYSLLKQAVCFNWVPCPRKLVRQLETAEVLELMGCPLDLLDFPHTPHTDIRKFLAESFHVPTMELLLGALKDSPVNGLAEKCAAGAEGITVLSLCDGLGAAAVALHNLRIPVAKYIIVEIEDKRRRIAEHFLTDKFIYPQGTVVHVFEDVLLAPSDPDFRSLLELGVDLIVCGSPCSNVTGANRARTDNGRTGLGGPKSSVFYACYAIRELALALHPKTNKASGTDFLRPSEQFFPVLPPQLGNKSSDSGSKK